MGNVPYLHATICTSPQGSDFEGIKIISHFDTLDELKAAVENPNAGDAYSVGSNLPYNLYIYDYLYTTWRDYGAIRSTDISARFSQNVSVGVDAWEEDEDVFVDYTYKAAIPLGEVTGSDFPIVAFSPDDAAGGNFSPVAFCFDGKVEVWAKSIPTSAIVIPAITFIVQEDVGGANGNSTKGITNASGGISTGSIGTPQIADGSMITSKYANASVTRAKLAQDALFSPFVRISGNYVITTSDTGKTITTTWDANLTVTLTQENSATFPSGAEIAICAFGTKNEVTLISDGVILLVSGESSLAKNKTVKIPEPFGMIALKKIANDSTGNSWLVTGNVEVVSE